MPATRSRRLIKLGVALVVIAGLALLFARSARDSRAKPYTIERRDLTNWTLAAEPPLGPNDPVMALQPPAGMMAGLFNQVFRRAMESLTSPAGAGIPLLLKGEFDRAFLGHVPADALATAANNAGLADLTLTPRCLGYRRVSSLEGNRQLYFILFDAPPIEAFRLKAGALLEAGGGHPADFDPAALAPVLFVAGTDANFARWLPFRPDAKTDCIAPIAIE